MRSLAAKGPGAATHLPFYPYSSLNESPKQLISVMEQLPLKHFGVKQYGGHVAEESVETL